MVIRKEDQRLQVRDNIRGGQGRLENRHILEPEQMFDSASLLTEFFSIPATASAPMSTIPTRRSIMCWRES